MTLDFNSVSEQPTYFIHSDFNSSSIIKSAASLGVDNISQDFSILKVANTAQIKAEKSPFKPEEDQRQRALDKEEGMPDKNISAVLVAVTRKNRLALELGSPMSSEEQVVVANQIQQVLESKDLDVGAKTVVGLKFPLILVSTSGEVANLGDYHLKIKVKNTGKEGFRKFEIEDMDTDFSAIFVENKGKAATIPVKQIDTRTPPTWL